MTRKLFGTDGIRGRANVEPMTAETALKVATAAAAQFRRGDHRHLVVIGKDTRLSGYLLEPALTAGFIGAGMDVILVGPMPTPAIAMLTRSLRADLGVMISASHNPFEDNGIKLFGPDGYKLSDEVEKAIEDRIVLPPDDQLAAPSKLGRARRLDDASGRYIEYAKNTFPKGLRLDGLKVVVDCANGAAYKVAPAVLWELGADVISIGVAPDGLNINTGCGATATDVMQQAVVAHGAHLGLSLDGDADRLIMADETGRQIDGDQLMAMIARDWFASGRLAQPTVAATVMSNLGMERFLDGLGIALIRTAVGDRYVVETMRDRGLNLGGEQSGHIVMPAFGTTGDGIVTGLRVMSRMAQTRKSLAALAEPMRTLPQVLINVEVADKATVADAPSVRTAVAAAEAELGDSGRILLRPSGTEQVVRVMVEAADEDTARQLAVRVAESVSDQP
jgi:phosphoglucosamine mutase